MSICPSHVGKVRAAPLTAPLDQLVQAPTKIDVLVDIFLIYCGGIAWMYRRSARSSRQQNE
jgi:hypothetical protein